MASAGARGQRVVVRVAVARRARARAGARPRSGARAPASTSSPMTKSVPRPPAPSTSSAKRGTATRWTSARASARHQLRWQPVDAPRSAAARRGRRRWRRARASAAHPPRTRMTQTSFATCRSTLGTRRKRWIDGWRFSSSWMGISSTRKPSRQARTTNSRGEHVDVHHAGPDHRDAAARGGRPSARGCPCPGSRAAPAAARCAPASPPGG